MNLLLFLYLNIFFSYEIISVVGPKYSGKTTLLNYIIYTSHLNMISKECLLKLFVQIFFTEIENKINFNMKYVNITIKNNNIYLNDEIFKFNNQLLELYEQVKNNINILNLISTCFIRKIKSNKNLIVENLICSKKIILIERNINLRASYYFRENIFLSLLTIKDIFKSDNEQYLNYVIPYLKCNDYIIYTIFNNNFITEPVNIIGSILRLNNFYF